MDRVDESQRERPDNGEIAGLLDRIADLLDTQTENPFRVLAYRNAAHTVRGMRRSAAALLKAGGRPAIEQLPGIGKSIATLLDEFVHTGRSGMLDRLEGQVSPEDRFTTVPGIGEVLARRIHHELGIETLEDLEVVAHDGRLEAVSGVGSRRASAIRDSVTAILDRSMRRRAHRRHAPRHEPGPDRAHAPDVGMLLTVDSEYRRRAEAGELKTITPRRFNPKRRAWLPVFHTQREGWSFTALYSNTARAHELGTTHDWVVVYFERDGDEDQCTVVTERRGALAGRRVVRGRESECAGLDADATTRRVSPTRPGSSPNA